MMGNVDQFPQNCKVELQLDVTEGYFYGRLIYVEIHVFDCHKADIHEDTGQVVQLQDDFPV